MLTSQKRRRGKNHLICFIPVFGGSGQSYLGAIVLHSLSDTHSSSAEQDILVLPLGLVKNNKLYQRLGDAFYMSLVNLAVKNLHELCKCAAILLTSGKQQTGKKTVLKKIFSVILQGKFFIS